MDTPDFLRARERDELLESAQVYDRWYGVPRWQVRDPLIAGQDVILEIDVQGAATIRTIAPEALSIFVMPASMDELRQRLARRGTEDESEIAPCRKSTPSSPPKNAGSTPASSKCCRLPVIPAKAGIQERI